MDIDSLLGGLLWAIYLFSLYFVVFWFLVLFDKKTEQPKAKKLKELPSVTICVPGYNVEKRSVKLTVDSLVSLNYPKDKLQIILVDHGSSDKTAEVFNSYKHHGNIEVLSIGRSKGHMKGFAVNAALKKAKGDFFVTLDVDSFVKDKDILRKLLPHFSSEKIAVVLPALKIHNPKNMLQKLQWYEYIINIFYKRIMARLNCIHVAPGPFSVYRTSALREVGGYDGYNLTDDLEMTIKIQKAQYTLLQLKGLEVYTIAPATFKTLYSQRNRWFTGTIQTLMKYRNMIFNKKYGDFGMIQLPTIAASAVVASSMVIIFTYQTFQPLVNFIQKLPSIGYDILALIRAFTFDFHILDLDFFTLLTVSVLTGFAIVVYKLSHRDAKEHIFKQGKTALTLTFLFYFFILGIAWMGAIFDVAIGRKREWYQHKEELIN